MVCESVGMIYDTLGTHGGSVGVMRSIFSLPSDFPQIQKTPDKSAKIRWL